jgi:hypothetical protein
MELTEGRIVAAHKNRERGAPIDCNINHKTALKCRPRITFF